MAMGEKERKQLMGVLIALPILMIVAFWMYVRTPRATEIAEATRVIDSLQAAVDSARQDLASGTVEQLRARIAEYESGLGLMRLLVPTDAEVATLINDISDRARLRNMEIADFSPLGDEAGARFRVKRYRFQAFGHYDDIGSFLSDIAALPRIMVPHQLSIVPATEQEAASYADTTGSLLRASFQLRTFVKQSVSGLDDGGSGAP